MRPHRLIAALAVGLAVFPARSGVAADRPAVHELREFLARGAFTELKRELAQRPLSLAEIEKDGLDGRPRPVLDILETMARYEKLNAKIAEPLEVHGEMSVRLTPNTTGEEAYTACFLAFTYNGLAVSGQGKDLVLVRSETRPELPSPKRKWDASRILGTRLLRLGYLAPDPILRRYREEIGTAEGHAIIVPKANVVIAIDTEPALEKLATLVDEETMAAMGAAPRHSAAAAEGLRPPSAGAMTSRACVHFYLQAFARRHDIPMFGTLDPQSAPKSYPEMNVWLSQRGSVTLGQEYRRVMGLPALAREAAAAGWVDPRPDRVLTPAQQRRKEIRFGLASSLDEDRARGRTTRKSTRRKR